jgi:predicted permease
VLNILTIVTPVFLVVAAGYAAVWRGMFSNAAVDGLMVFTQKFAVPCLLFSAMSRLDVAAAFDLRVLAAYFISALTSFALAGFGARLLFSRPVEDCIAIGFAVMFANTLLLGLPVTERAYGSEALDANFTIIAFNAAFCYFVGITTMEFARAGFAGQALIRTVAGAMFRNEIMLSIAAGLTVNLLAIPVAEVFSDAVDLIGRAALPAALFGLGGVIYRYKPEGDTRTIVFLCVLSLLVQPGMSFALGHLLDLENEQLRSVVITAAMAPGITAYIFADMYGVARRVVASTILFGTALTVVTASFWLTVLP